MEVFDAGCAFRGKDFLSLQFFAEGPLAEFCEFEFVVQIKGVQVVTLVTCADMFMVTLVVTLNTSLVTPPGQPSIRRVQAFLGAVLQPRGMLPELPTDRLFSVPREALPFAAFS